jgi:spore maturation protein A
MKYLFTAIIVLSAVYGIFSGNTEAVSNAVLEEGVNAVELSMYMLGGMCVWGGIMRVAEKSGITDFICHLFSPMAKFLFKGINSKGKAFKAICMNVTANLLGLGNAATPFGIEAMKELEKEEKTGDTASPNMVLFTVLNTSSITLIPAAVASLRLKHGSQTPLDILPAVLINSLISVSFALITATVLNSVFLKREK